MNLLHYPIRVKLLEKYKTIHNPNILPGKEYWLVALQVEGGALQALVVGDDNAFHYQMAHYFEVVDTDQFYNRTCSNYKNDCAKDVKPEPDGQDRPVPNQKPEAKEEPFKDEVKSPFLNSIGIKRVRK